MTIYVAAWPITDPDLPIADLKEEARADLRATLADAGLEAARPVAFTVRHGAAPELRATVHVRPESWRRGLTTENLRALRTVTRCTCGAWTCGQRYQRTPHNCDREEVMSHV